MHTLSGQPAFAGLESTATTVPGVIVSERVGVAIASVLARKGRTQELANRVRAQFGIELPVGPRMTRAPGLAFVGIGVAAWLALSDTADVPSALQAELGECASLSDHSSALALLRLTGAKVRATLAKLLPLDLHDRAFGILNAASSVAAHVSTRIWRLEDSEHGAVFELGVPRSFAVSFAQALQTSAAEFGLVFKPG